MPRLNLRGADSDKKSAGVLERSSEIQELEKAIAEDRKQLNAIREEYEQVEDQRNKAAAEVESLRETLGELNKVSAAYDSDGRAQKEKIERTIEARDKNGSQPQTFRPRTFESLIQCRAFKV